MANPDGPWVRFYASDWLAGTRGMTAAETGVYITLIAIMYEHAEPIERNDSRLSRMCGLPRVGFSRILDALIEAEKIVVIDSKLWGRKVDVEVQNRKARAEKSSKAAKEKHERKQREVSANAQAKQEPSTSQKLPRARGSEPEPDSKVIETLEAAQPKKAARLAPDWSPAPSDDQWLRDKWPGIPRALVQTELEKFRNYWLAKSGKDATKLDWSRTWQNWMISAVERQGTRPAAATKPPTAADIGRMFIERIDEHERQTAHRADNPAPRQLAGPSQR